MKREEIIDIIQYNMELDDYGNHIYYTAICDEILSAIKHEKIELLKEFVKWYKKVLEKDYDDKAKLVSINLERNNDKDFWYFTGQCSAIQRLIDLLDKDLENFLEENSYEN